MPDELLTSKLTSFSNTLTTPTIPEETVRQNRARLVVIELGERAGSVCDPERQA